MKNLFDQFEQLSTEAQGLLEAGIRHMRDGYVLGSASYQNIVTALSELRAIYDQIRQTAVETGIADTLPDGELAIHEYEEAWQNSVVKRNQVVRGVLEEFIRVYSDEKKYMDAIEEYLHRAKELLDGIRTDDTRKAPDVSTYQLFLEGVKADLVEDEALSDRIWESSVFNRTIIRGLTEDKYRITAISMPSDGEKADPAVEKGVRSDTTIGGPEEAANEVSAEGADVPDVQKEDSDVDGGEIETLTPEEFAAKYAPTLTEASDETKSADEVENGDITDNTDEIPEEFIHPINPIKPMKLPSDQKMSELIHRTGNIFGLLVDKLVFTGLMDENAVFDALSQLSRPVSREQCIDAFTYLERKGLLCTYEFEGRNILCFTELMDNCLQKASLNSIMKRMLNLKKIGKMHISGKQDMPVSQFTHYLALADDYTNVINMLLEDDESAKALETSSWNTLNEHFVMNLTRDEGDILPLRIVPEATYAQTIPAEGEGLFCSGYELPAMSGVKDALHYYLTPRGLYLWSDNEWQAVTHIEEQQPDSEDTEDIALDSNPAQAFPGDMDEPSDVTIEAQVTATPHDDESADKNGVSEAQPEGLWLDDLSENEIVDLEAASDDFDDLSAADIAKKLLDATASGTVPSDDSMAHLIHRLLSEGVRNYDLHNMHDQLVEAIVLARVLSANAAFPKCKAIYDQLHAALHVFRENSSNSGVTLSTVFADETEYTGITKLCAFIYGMLFPAHAHDHTFAALYNSAFSEFETQFPGFELFKPLYHKAMEGLRLVPTAFSPANLAALSDSRMRQERMNALRAKAKELLTNPTVKVKINGVPELIDLCFGSQTELHAALEVVSENELEMRDLSKEELNRYCKDGEIDQSAIERLLDSQWSSAAQKYSSRRMGIKYDARKHLINAFVERLTVINDWLEETDTEAAPDLEKLRTIRNDIVRIIDGAITDSDSIIDTAARSIAQASLQLIKAKIQNQGTSIIFSTMLRSGALVIDDDELILNDSLNEIVFAEPWRMMLQHIACTDYDLFAVYEKMLSTTSDSALYDNFGQLSAIGRLIGADPRDYELSSEGLRDAISSANVQARNFREKLEISYAYNRINENDRERLAMLADPDTSEFQQFFYGHKAFGCWRAFLEALRSQIRIAARHSMHDVRSQLERAKSSLPQGKESQLLTEAERLITQEQNYAVAEDYIHRFLNGERDLPYETNDGTIRHYLNFIADDSYTALYSYCERRKDSPLSKAVMQYIERNRPEGWTSRHIEDAQRFIDRWPTNKQGVNTLNVQEFFKQLGFSVTACLKAMRNNEVCCTLTVNRSEQNLADYRHPISLFGTQMKRQIEVVCLFGKRTAKQLIDDACRLGISGLFIVLLDANLSATDRRTMAQYFFTQKNVGQASFLVVDRVLALYLAMQSNNERLPAMLQCTLPYTIYQPFTNGSGSTADEMFFGRVSELASIRDMTGSSIVYGGRQLGKTALLERAKHLDNNPSKREFAVMTSFKGCRTEQAFLDILIGACNETFEGSGIKIADCSSIREFSTQIRKLIESEKISALRLLLDETDDFLESISATSYSEIQPLIELQRGSNRRFKFVLAGLHNVCRAKNATRNNGLFGQLGQPLCVKPLTPADARNLLVRPLRYLGFRVPNDSHVDTILTNTNYYPGIIQFFGYTLVQTLASQYTQYYDAVRGNPPFELHDEQLASIMNSKDLNRNIKDRLRWTLEMDDRYYMLARCITVLYHLSGNDYSMISNGFNVVSILEVAKDMFEILCLSRLTETETIALLDEMEEMGILSKPNAEQNRYLLRRRSFIDVIGASLEELEHDIEEALTNA